MINTNLFTVFPIFDDLQKQNRFKEGCRDDVCTFRLYCSKERLLPFQFRRSPSPAPLTSIKLVCHDQGWDNEILGDIPAGQIEYSTAGSWDYISYWGTEDLATDLDCGDFYLEITDGDSIWYSEIFHVSDDVVLLLDYRISRIGTYREWDDNELRIWR